MAWANDYKPEAGHKEGDYRFEVTEAVEKTSKSSGKRMYEVSLKLNGSKITVKDYFVEGDSFCRKTTQFFDATNIDRGDFNILTWAGAVGAACFKKNDDGYLRVSYYIAVDTDREKKITPWQGEMPERQTVTSLDGLPEADDDTELPF